MIRCKCRLTIVGSPHRVRTMTDSSGWVRTLKARHVVWMELSVGRYVAEFDTDEPRLQSLRKLSDRHAGVLLLLDYEHEGRRIRGLAKATANQVEHCEFSY